MNIPVDDLIQRFDAPEVRSLVLMGSHARKEAGPYSDIDLVRFTNGAEIAGADSYLFQDRLLVVSDISPDEVEKWFYEPHAATDTIGGLRRAQALLDRENYFAEIQARAHAFVWDEVMQQRANRWASEMLVGNAEEAHKGLEGLRRNDIGRMLQARFGCSWNISRIMKVQHGVLLSSDNGVYEEVAQAMSDQPAWLNLCRTAFGIESIDGHAPTLREQVQAGLLLYMLTAEMLSPVVSPEHRPLIEHTVSLIRAAFPAW